MSRSVECVLLADPHPGLTEGIRGLLASVFDVVIMVADERSLLEATGQIQLRLVVIDLSLARPDGLGFLREMRRLHPRLRIIVLSDHPGPSVMDSVLKAGADGCVLRRRLGTDLLPAVEAVLSGRQFASAVC